MALSFVPAVVLPLITDGPKPGGGDTFDVNHWVVGSIALVILLGLLLAVVSFGGGREHS